jgi:NADH-quinone oxidoreductase subunit N
MFEVPNMMLALPEMTLLGLACSVLLLLAFTGKSKMQLIYSASQFSLLITMIILAMNLGESGTTFSETYIKDAFADVLKLAICFINIIVLLYTQQYLRDRQLWQGEFYVLGLFATLGMLIMVSASYFLSLYLGLELLSLCLYAMVAMQRDSKLATEAAMKYFILGAIASGMLLYGMSILYGATGTLVLSELAAVLAQPNINMTIVSFGVVFLIIGIGFKLGAVPFHMWLPDVYHGAPTAMTLFIATAPKVAGFAMMIRLLVDGLWVVESSWQDMLILLAVASMILGNVVAIAQINLKRMLAYSTISHIGFLLMGVLSGSEAGFAAAMFYTLVYALTSLGAFGMILLMSRQGFEAEEINDYKGLSQQQPWFALMMLILMFSMAGIPPLAGFYAKLVVINAVIEAGFISVAIIAVLASVVGAFYYLRIIKVMYFDPPETEQPIHASSAMQIMLSVNALWLLAIGLFPSLLLSICFAVLS